MNLTQEDSAQFLRPWTVADVRARALLYLDPPYFAKGEGLYDNFYTPRDHEHIARIVKEVNHPWIVSYDAVPEGMDLYSEFSSLRYGLSYSAHTASTGNEVMFFSPDLVMPDEHPAGKTVGDVQTAMFANDPAQ